MFSGADSEKSEEKEDKAPGSEADPKTEAPAREEPTAAADADRPDETPLPEVNFPTFILSLNASALVHLGAIEDPATGRATKNLPMAKQTIDILSMLEEKTSGNLTNDEQDMLKNILYDLRIAYVKEKA
jgi:hypothetical protein